MNRPGWFAPLEASESAFLAFLIPLALLPKTISDSDNFRQNRATETGSKILLSNMNPLNPCFCTQQ